jgi:Predicted Zn peptidase
MFERVSGKVELPGYQKLIIENEAEQYAYEIRKQINVAIELPIDLIEVIEKQFNTYVFQLVDLQVSGFIRVINGKKVIFLNGSESLGRQLYTAAHELCHILRDLPHIKEIESLDEEERESKLKEMEYFAYKFADYFLTPRPALIQSIAELKISDLRLLEPIHIFNIQNRFRISYRQAVRMLHKIGVITEKQRNELGSISSKENPNLLLEMAQKAGYSNELSLPLAESRIPKIFYSSIKENSIHSRISSRKLTYLSEMLQISFGSKDGSAE